MSIDELIIFFFMILGLNLLMVWGAFANPVGVLVKMFPEKKPKDYDEYIKERRAEQFKKHRKKWTKKYSLIAFGSAIVYILIAIITDDVFIALVSDFIIFSIWSIPAQKKEMEERRNLNK